MSRKTIVTLQNVKLLEFMVLFGILPVKDPMKLSLYATHYLWRNVPSHFFLREWKGSGLWSLYF
jgi:hypothetical protein